MDREANYLLHLLRAHMRAEEPSPCPEVDWDALMRLAHIHNVSGILGYMAMSWPICPDPDKNAALRTVCLSTISGYANRAALAEQFSKTLADSGIDHILMKGFLLRNLYPVPELRTFGDIDIVIRPEDRQRCHSKMLELGYQVKNDWEPVYSYCKGSEYYEIHTQLLETDVSDRADFRAYFRDPWDRAVAVDTHRWQFTPEFHFLYLITHIAKHVSGSGAGVRMYLDVAAFLQNGATGLDWASVQQELKTLELETFAATVLSFVEDQFGVVCPMALQPVPREVKEAFAEFTMSGGIFGKSARDSGTNSLKNESRDSGAVSRTATLAKRLFPSARSIQDRYTYLQERPWLLPAAWVHRLVKTRQGWQEHTREAKNILAADKEEVRALNRFYRDIGL